MKNNTSKAKKSKILIASTILSTIISNVFFAYVTYISDLNEYVRAFAVLLWPFLLLAFGMAVFEIVTSWRLLSSNKPMLLVINTITLLLICFVGVFLMVSRLNFLSLIFFFVGIIAVILRITGFIIQRKINKKRS